MSVSFSAEEWNKLVPYAFSHDHDDDHWNCVFAVQACPARELQAVSFISLCDEIIESPAVTLCAEEEEQQGTEGKEDVADKEVLKIQYACSGSEWLEG